MTSSSSTNGRSDAHRPTPATDSGGPIRVGHVWSSDMGAALGLPRMRPFAEAGWQLTVMCPPGPRIQAVVDAGIEWLPLSFQRSVATPAADLRGCWQLLRYCRSRRFDIVHTHNIKTGLFGRVVSRLAGAPRVVHTHHGMAFGLETPIGKRLPHVALEWAACRFCDRVLVQSRADEQAVIRSRVIAPERVVRIGNGVDLDRFKPDPSARGSVFAELGLASDTVLFVSAGRLVHDKGFLDLGAATAIARAREPRIAVAIAGPLDRARADCLSDGDLASLRAAGVLWLGERDDMPRLLAAADAVVLPSWREGLPRVLLEAAACGKPLIATDIRGCREVVNAPSGGELVPARDPAALAAALVAWARHPERRAACGARNLTRARAEFDVRAVTARIEAVYRELLQTR